MQKEHKINLGLFHLSWPMFIEQITGGMVTFVDTLFISMISDRAAASIGMLGSVLMLGYFILPQFTNAGTSAGAAGYKATVGRSIGFDPEAIVHARLILAWGANIVSSRRSSGPKMRFLSEWTVAMAPTKRRPMRSGAAITECTITSAYCPERPSHS